MRKRTKKAGAMILSLVLAFTGLEINPADANAAEEEILISSATELAKIGNDAEYPLNGKYKLAQDIENVETIIGSTTNPFTGVFDGAGHEVVLNISEGENYTGLFGAIESAEIKNVLVKGSLQVKYGYTAGIAAKAENSTITKCGSEVEIQSAGNNSTCFAGIAGYAKSCTITECYNTGSIGGKIKNAGGIVGQSNTEIHIENCYNTGAVTTTSTSTARVGGIVGYGMCTANQGQISQCYNSGVVTGTSQAGSFIGYLYTGFTVSNCFWLEGTHETGYGFQYEADTSGIIMTTPEQLKSLQIGLGDAFTVQDNFNQGYPVLKWQVSSTDTTQQDMAVLQELVKELPSGVLTPSFNRDKNINTYLNSLIESKEAYQGKGITVSVKSVENRMGDTQTYIEEDGTIHYFYKSLFETTPTIYFGQADVVFELRLNNAVTEYSPSCVNIYWDLDKIKEDMNTVAEEYNAESILGDNPSLNEVTQNLSLPVYPVINHNGTEKTVKWVSATYTSSNPDVIRISNTDTWDRNYTNRYYQATVVPASKDTEVVITAKFTFDRYTMNSKEDTLTEKITREIRIMVPGENTEEKEIQMLQEQLETYAGFMKDFQTGDTLDFDHVTGDIQLTRPRELGIDGKYYNISVESSAPSVIEINGYRTYTYRPLPEEEKQNVTLTVTITNKENASISASKEIHLTVIPLVQEEIEHAVQFMEKAKGQFFDFIRNENTDKENIISDLKTFYGIYENPDGMLYTSSYVDKPDNNGILVNVVNPEEEVPDYIRYWTSDHNEIISDQTLRVTIPQYDTKVTVGTVLSYEVFEKYAEHYKNEKTYGEIFGALTNQYVSVELTVKGTDGEKPTETATEKPTQTLPSASPTTTPATKPDNTTKPTDNSRKNIVKKLSMKKVKTSKRKKKIRISWKRNSYADGYQIVYAKNRKFKKARKITIKSSKKTWKLLGLFGKAQKKTVYYIKIRAFKRKNGKCIYGKWAKRKKVKFK